MKTFTFDVETNGLLDTLTEIKCLNVIDSDGNERRYTDYPYYLDAWTGELTDTLCQRAGNIADGLQFLDVADEIAGHNIEGFDLPALRKVCPDWEPKAAIFDTIVVCRLMYPDVKDRDAIAMRKGRFVMPKALYAKPHSLEAWGIRLGETLKTHFNPKDFGHTWQDYPFSMQCDNYCMDDVRSNVVLVRRLKKRLLEQAIPPAVMQLEQDVARIISRQEKYGWLYDIKAAEKLTVKLMKAKLDLEEKLIATFGDFYKFGPVVTTKRTCKRFIVSDKGAITRKYKGEEQRGWYSYTTAGVEHQSVKLTQFNPGSRDHISNRLTEQFGWIPMEFTPNGKAKVDEDTLAGLTYPEAKLLIKYFKTNKMLSQVSDGKVSQLKMVRKDGRIHGRVTTNGAVTGRMTHSSPNVAQTDKDARVRSLYIASPGKKLVGADAAGLELRCLAHFLARYDDGAYIDVILKGSKKDGSDMHTRTKKSIGMNSRDHAKTFFYAWAYGAGDLLLGTHMYEDWPEDKQDRFNGRYAGETRKKKLVMIGQRARATMIAGIPGLDVLIKKVKARAKNPGYIKGLDGRRIICRSLHAALNTLLQGAGAIVMKKALVILDDKLQATGLVPGVDYEFVGNIHDEFQLEVSNEHTTIVGRFATQSISAAGKHFGFRCPLAGEYKVGSSWAETH